MGWIKDAFNWVGDQIDKITDWIREQLEKAQQWLIESINWLSEEIRVWRYRFRKAIAEWLENPFLFWLSIITVVGLAIYAPQLAALLVKSKIFTTIKKIIADIKELGGKLLLKINYIQLLAIHKVGLIFFPDYQDFWGKLDEAFAGLAEEIQVGVGTLNTMMIATRNLYYSTYSMLGYNSDMIESSFYTDATAWTAKVNKNIEKYIRDPQAIFTDLQNELVFPLLEQQSIHGEEQATYLLEQNKKIQDFIEKTDLVRLDLNAWVAGLPDEIESVVNKHIGKGLAAINDFYTEKLLPMADKFDRAAAVIDETIKQVKDAMEINAKRDSDLMTAVRRALFGGALETIENRKMLSSLLGKIMLSDAESFEDATLLIDMGRHYKPNEDKTGTIYKPSTGSSLSGKLDLSNIAYASGGWFIGEY